MCARPPSRRPRWSTASLHRPLLKEGSAGATHQRPPRARTCHFHVHVCKCSAQQHVVKVSCAPPLEFIQSEFFSDNHSFRPVNKFKKQIGKVRLLVPLLCRRSRPKHTILEPLSDLVCRPTCSEHVSKRVDIRRELNPISVFFSTEAINSGLKVLLFGVRGCSGYLIDP